MYLIKNFLMKFGSLRSQTKVASSDGMGQLQVESLVQAHGDWLALLVTILERESIITAAELARSLSEFAKVTAEDRPAEGQILILWASRLTDISASLNDFPSVH